VAHFGLRHNFLSLSQARGLARSAWHHEAVDFSWMGREETSRLLLRRPSGSEEASYLPADAARANRPTPRATSRWVSSQRTIE
jgi:hypothetical protein